MCTELSLKEIGPLWGASWAVLEGVHWFTSDFGAWDVPLSCCSLAYGGPTLGPALVLGPCGGGAFWPKLQMCKI